MIPARRIPYLSDAGLLIGRLALGVVFIAHGWQKLHDLKHSGVTKMFDAMGVPMPEVSAFYATWVELIGGIALIAGVVVPLVGLLLAADMAGAFWFVHSDKGFFADKGGYEFVLVLGALSLLFVLAGGGRFSVDALLWRGREAAPDREPAAGPRTSTV